MTIWFESARDNHDAFAQELYRPQNRAAVPPYRRGGTLSVSGAIWAILIDPQMVRRTQQVAHSTK